MWDGHTEEAAFCASPEKLGLSAVEMDPRSLPAPLQQYHQSVRRPEEEAAGKQFQWVYIRDVMWTLQPETLLLPSSSLPDDVSMTSLPDDVSTATTGTTGGGGGFMSSWEAYQRKMGEDGAVKAQFERKKELAEYYVAQVELFATMCFDRR